MKSTPDITKYTPALLKSICKDRRISKRKYRLITLKRIQAELCLLLENSAGPLHDQDREILTKLDHVARLAIGQE